MKKSHSGKQSRVPDRIQELYRKKIIPITFERTIGLFGATTIGVGALMGAGLYVLIGLAAGAAGPSVWIAYIICGALAFLTTLMFAELARIVPKTGGGYAYAYDSLGSLGGFVTGWFLALGSIFACAIYALGFAHYFSSILGYSTSALGIKALAMTAVISVTLLNRRGTKDSNVFQNIFTWGNLAVLAILIIFSLFKLQTEELTPMFPNGFSGAGAAISIIYISFFGYQLIANNADEIVEPTKTIPKAMILSIGISTIFYLLVALTSVMVINWQQLAESGAPLLQVASKSIGKSGWFLISAGGILASAGALNSTLLSKGRQIFAMGKNGFLPGILGKIHEAKKTPQAALLAGSLLVLISLSLLDLEFIAKSANFCLLVSLLPISFALRKIYRSNKSQLPPVFWKRYLPEAAFIANLALLLTLDWISLVFGMQLAGIGAAIYFFYSRKREVRRRTGINIVLAEKEKKPFLSLGTRILVPMANPQTQQAIFAVANALLSKSSGEIVSLSVVNTPEQMDFYSALSTADYSLDIIQRSAHMANLSQVPIRPVIRASRSIPKGIVHTAEEEACNLIVMGYTGQDSGESSRLMEEVLDRSRTDIIILKSKKIEAEFSPKNIAVSLGGGFTTNLDLMVRLAGTLADQFSGKITFLNILPINYTAEQKSRTDRIFIGAIQKHSAKALYNVQVLASDNPLETLVEKSADFDLLVVGTIRVGLLERTVVGTFATQIAERSYCSVAIVNVPPKAKKIIKKI